MSAKQRELRHADYLEHMHTAIDLACSHVEGNGSRECDEPQTNQASSLTNSGCLSNILNKLTTARMGTASPRS